LLYFAHWAGRYRDLVSAYLPTVRTPSGRIGEVTGSATKNLPALIPANAAAAGPAMTQ
jgi:hypothetical protein